MNSVSEPITSLRCPGCGALVPIFERKPMLRCSACGAEFPVSYVERADMAKLASEGDLMPMAVAGFVLWFLSRFRK